MFRFSGWIASVTLLANFLVLNAEAKEPDPIYAPGVMATVFNLTRVKILESNNVTLRTGSVYDNMTYFESLLRFPQPGFVYEFLDSGLGAAEPLYPMYQKGNQESYFQLIPSFFSPENRHIDHYTSVETPEGCKVDSMYLLRSLNEYPDSFRPVERAAGFKQIVVKLEYYTLHRPDAQCGRHRVNAPDPNFDPMAYLKAHHDAMTLADFPKKYYGRFEAKMSAIWQIEETMSPQWPRFDWNKFDHNSLWYYPDSHAFNFGIDKPHPQPGMTYFDKPEHMVVAATAATQTAFPFSAMLTAGEFQQVHDFWTAKPIPNFDPATEPGHDTLNLSDVTKDNFYTSGLDIVHIKNVESDVSNMGNYKLVAMTIKPYEEQEDVSWSGTKVIPQIRFVYQMMNPKHLDRPFEQLFVHLKWDVVDRNADEATRNAQHKYFLSRLDDLTRVRTSGGDSEAAVQAFITEFTHARPIETISFGSALTGIWIFGSLSRDLNAARALEAIRIVRNGIDAGYYSSAYDNDLFREAIQNSTGQRKASLENHLADLTVSYFRDPKRQDAEKINFNRVTCAQCHQMSARDGVHMSFNDGLDRRFTAPVIASEFFFHDAELQLQSAQSYWARAH